MKLLMIVSGEEYTASITSLLDNKGFLITEIGSSGDFLEYGRTVYLLGVQDQDVETVIDVLCSNSEINTTAELTYHNEVAVYVMDMLVFKKVKPCKG